MSLVFLVLWLLFGTGYNLRFGKVILLFEVTDPRVVEHFDQRQPFVGFVFENRGHEIFILVGEARLEFDDATHDLF